MYSKIVTGNSNIILIHALKLAVEAVNDTAGSNVLVPIFLMFGVMPRLSINPSNLPVQIARLKAMKDVREEALRTIVQSRLVRANSKLTSGSAMRCFSLEKTCG